MNSRMLHDADWGEIVRQDAALRLGLPLADRSPQAASMAISHGEVAAAWLMTREQVLVMLWPEGRRPAREAVRLGNLKLVKGEVGGRLDVFG